MVVVQVRQIPIGSLGTQDLLEAMRVGNFLSKLIAWEKHRRFSANSGLVMLVVHWDIHSVPI
eukprot:1421523-Pyramimonas_sp.AAC.1